MSFALCLQQFYFVLLIFFNEVWSDWLLQTSALIDDWSIYWSDFTEQTNRFFISPVVKNFVWHHNLVLIWLARWCWAAVSRFLLLDVFRSSFCGLIVLGFDLWPLVSASDIVASTLFKGNMRTHPPPPPLCSDWSGRSEHQGVTSVTSVLKPGAAPCRGRVTFRTL